MMEGNLALDYVMDENGTWATKGAALKWYRKELAEAKHDIEHALQSITILEKELQAKQAEVDRLMFEYCPDQMSVEQIINWSNHQRALENDKLLD